MDGADGVGKSGFFLLTFERSGSISAIGDEGKRLLSKFSCLFSLVPIFFWKYGYCNNLRITKSLHFVSTIDCIRAVRLAGGPSDRGMEIQSGSGGKPLEVQRFYPNPSTDKVRAASSQSKFDFIYFICLFHLNLSAKISMYIAPDLMSCTF